MVHPAAPGSFQPGLPGGPCAPTSVIADLHETTPPLVQGAVRPGTYTAQLRDAMTNAVVGTMNFIAQTPAGNTFHGPGPSRIGWSSSGSWIIDLQTAIVLGQLWVYSVFRACVLNSSVNAANPVIFEQLNALDQVIATTLFTALICQDIQILAATRRLRLRGTGLGLFADANGFGGNGAQVPQPL